jgi:hypothetical protein
MGRKNGEVLPLSGSSGAGPPPPVSPTPCEDLAFRTTLQSPVEDVVSRLQKGDVLDLELRNLQGAPVVIAGSANGDAGSITGRMPELIRCLQAGAEFVAEVVSVDDGLVVVDVKPKPA